MAWNLKNSLLQFSKLYLSNKATKTIELRKTTTKNVLTVVLYMKN